MNHGTFIAGATTKTTTPNSRFVDTTAAPTLEKTTTTTFVFKTSSTVNFKITLSL